MHLWQNSWQVIHDDIIKWKHFLCYWPFVWGIHWSLVDSPYKGQWSRALMFSLVCAWINGWVNSHEAGDLRRHHTHYDIIVMTNGKLWLIQVMVWPLFGTKPFPEPRLTYRQELWRHSSVKFESAWYNVQWKKCIWKCCLQNVVPILF